MRRPVDARFLALPVRAGVVAAVAAGVALSAAGATPRNALAGSCDAFNLVGEFAPADIDALVTAFGQEAVLYPPAVCGAQVYQLLYSTTAPDGSPTPASAGVLLPTDCGAGSPLVVFHHGTWTTINLSMSDATQHNVQELMAQFTAQGYAVVSPDGLGYDASTLTYHPYFQADNNAATSMDAVRATRACLDGQGVLGDGLFLTGSSEGGYVAMATLRAMEALDTGEFTVTASAPASGPYALAATTMQMVQQGDGIPGYAWMQIVGYQNSYGDVYQQPTDVFQEPYASEDGFQTLLPNPDTLAELVYEGLLPQDLEGLTGLLAGEFVLNYKIHSSTPARVRVLQNDLLNFAPKSPLAMCYGWSDTYAQQSAQSAFQWFASQGVRTTLADIGMMVQYMPYTEAMGNRDYHGSVEAPVCLAWAREHVFDAYRRQGHR
jgi:pimeloyl-ACP methyl ester carboxylesterase